MRTVCSSSRLSRGGSASVHAGIPTLPLGADPPGPGTPPRADPPSGTRHTPPGADPPVDRHTPVKT